MIEPTQGSLCANCVFFAGGDCPRFLGAAANSPEIALGDLFINGCGGFRPRDVVTAPETVVNPAPEPTGAV